MRWSLIILALLVAALQYPLWLGKGGWLRVWDVSRRLQEQRQLNESLERRNAGLEAEVLDLKDGLEAVEEQARFELGMTQPGEIFVQVPDAPRPLQVEPPPFVIPGKTPPGATPAKPDNSPVRPALPARPVASPKGAEKENPAGR